MQSNEVKWLPLKCLQPNTGQVPGLPGNPRQWTEGDVKRIARSLKETPELFVARPIIVLPFSTPGADDCYVILGGNLRSEVARRNKMQTVPCYILPSETPVDKLKEIVIKDNGSFGAWDYDALGNEWSDLPLPEWGVPAWEVDHIGDGLSSQGREGAEGYNDFVKKFEPKLTTDDCYTPQNVYEAIKKWVSENVTPLDGRAIVRPFYPGGDYKKERYPAGCLVLDNPPFSIYAEIVRWYLEQGIQFFLFGPQLTLSVRGADVTYVVADAAVTYENGAIVNTSFVTNLPELADYRIVIPPSLRDAVLAANADNKQTADLAKYKRPLELWTIPTLAKIAKGDDEFRIRKKDVQEIRTLDALKAIGKSLYGGGFLFSEAAAREAIPLNLSPAEQQIVDNLSK